MNGETEHPPEQSPEPAPIDSPGATFGVSPGKRTHGMVIAGLLATVSALSLYAAGPALPDGEMIAAVALVLAAVLFFYVRRTTGTAGPGMVLDGEGIWFGDWGLPVVPWRFVAGARMAGNRLRPLIYVELDDDEDLFAYMEDVTETRPAIAPLVRHNRLVVPNGALDAPLNEVAAAIRAAHGEAREMTKTSSLQALNPIAHATTKD